MGARGDRLAQRQSDQRQSRITNGHLKKKERKRRDDRMRGLIKQGKPPGMPAFGNPLVMTVRNCGSVAALRNFPLRRSTPATPSPLPP